MITIKCTAEQKEWLINTFLKSEEQCILEYPCKDIGGCVECLNTNINWEVLE